MTVTPQVSLPSNIVDGSTLVNAASVMPNFTALRDGLNSHTHDEFATTVVAGSGLTQSGNTLNVGAGHGISVNPDSIQVASGSIAQTDLAFTPTVPTDLLALSALAPTSDTRNQFQPVADQVLSRFRGATAGQTKNLTEWQKFSDGSLIAKVTATGRIASTDGVTTKVKAGVPVDGDFLATPEDGTLAVNTSTNQLYIRSGGVWRLVTPAAVTSPGTELAYGQITSTFSTTASAYTAVVSTPAFTYDGTRCRIECWASHIYVVGSAPCLAILRDGALVCAFSAYTNAATTVAGAAAQGILFDTPTAGSHTYTFAIRSDGSTNSIIYASAVGGSDGPCFIQVTKA